MYLSHRVDRTYADSLSRTDVLFKIFHVRPFFKEKAMYAVMPCGFAVFGMDAAPRHNHDIGVFADIEIVVNKVIDVTVCDTGGYGNSFTLCSRRNTYIKTRLVGF